MGTITYCDKCAKKQGQKSEGWVSLSVRNFGLKIKGLSDWNEIKLCPDCGKPVLTKLVKLLEPKKQ